MLWLERLRRFGRRWKTIPGSLALLKPCPPSATASSETHRRRTTCSREDDAGQVATDSRMGRDRLSHACGSRIDGVAVSDKAIRAGCLHACAADHLSG